MRALLCLPLLLLLVWQAGRVEAGAAEREVKKALRKGQQAARKGETTVAPTTGADFDDEGCDGEETARVVFETAQITRLWRCQQLNRHECETHHEAVEKCPCVCKRRHYYYNTNGVERPEDGEFEVETTTPFDYELERALKYELVELPSAGESGSGGSGGSGGGNKILCFSGDGQVRLEDGGVAKLSDVAALPNVNVLAYDAANGQLRYSPILYWIHADADAVGQFIHVTLSSGAQLSLTPDHLIHRSPTCEWDAVELVYAKRMRVGECALLRGADGRARLETVAATGSQVKRGVFAPVTGLGTLVVNEVVASCFANSENGRLQRAAHSALLHVNGLVGTLLDGCQSAAHTSGAPSFLLALNTLQSYFVRS